MTVHRQSKRVTHRQRRTHFVITFVKTYRGDVIAALDLYLQFLPLPATAADGLPQSCSQPFLDGLVSRLEQALAALIEAEHRHLNEVGDDAGPRRRRDEAIERLRTELLQARLLFRGAYSRPAAEGLGFERRIADDPVPLLRQAQRVEDHLGHIGDLGLTPHFPGLEVDREPVVRVIRERRLELRRALDDVTQDLARVQGSVVAKDKALKTFDDTYRSVVRCLVQAFRMAGMTELAYKIPVSPGRPFRKSADVPAALSQDSPSEDAPSDP